MKRVSTCSISNRRISQPTTKPIRRLPCSLESTTNRQQHNLNSFGNPSCALLLWRLKPKPLLSTEIQLILRWFLAPAPGANSVVNERLLLPVLSACESAGHILGSGAVVRRRNSVRFFRNICASWSRWMLMNRTSVTRSLSKVSSATSAMVLHRLSSSSTTTRLGHWMGSMEHSSKTLNQFMTNLRKFFKRSSFSPLVPLNIWVYFVFALSKKRWKSLRLDSKLRSARPADDSADFVSKPSMSDKRSW
mmetsp:Transcript_45146/g.78215  ORF Transcript_45146/g.78215 Transcript_45146/m.78215 type:complete len:248 (-) Transcript_45146:350-1093(-)